jgi:hypothetical protein
MVEARVGCEGQASVVKFCGENFTINASEILRNNTTNLPEFLRFAPFKLG